MPGDVVDLRARLRDYLGKTGQFPVPLARSLGLSQGTLTRFLNDERARLSLLTVEALTPVLCAHYGIPAEQVLREAGPISGNARVACRCRKCGKIGHKWPSALVKLANRGGADASYLCRGCCLAESRKRVRLECSRCHKVRECRPSEAAGLTSIAEGRPYVCRSCQSVANARRPCPRRSPARGASPRSDRQPQPAADTQSEGDRRR